MNKMEKMQRLVGVREQIIRISEEMKDLYPAMRKWGQLCNKRLSLQEEQERLDAQTTDITPIRVVLSKKSNEEKTLVSLLRGMSPEQRNALMETLGTGVGVGVEEDHDRPSSDS